MQVRAGGLGPWFCTVLLGSFKFKTWSESPAERMTLVNVAVQRLPVIAYLAPRAIGSSSKRKMKM